MIRSTTDVRQRGRTLQVLTLLGAVAALAADPAHAQTTVDMRRDATIVPARVRAVETSPAPDTMRAGHISAPMLATGAMMAAVGGQTIRSPTAWPRTAGGFARRVGDQVGYVIVEESVRATTLRLTGWRPDTRPCSADWLRLAPCAALHTFGARTADGRARVNLPLVLGIVGGTLTSLAWRPEGRAGGAKAGAFVATRLAISVGAPIIVRMFTESRRNRTPH